MDVVPLSRSLANMVLTEGELDSRESELQRYRQLPDILDKYDNLLLAYRRLRSDFEEERDAREKYKQMARNQSRHPFVLVLVDGDAYVFNDSFVSSGAAGGIEAARALNEAVQDNLRRQGLEHCQIMVRVYANVTGLSKALSRAGLSGPEKRSLAPFIASFNRTYGLCDMMDAGDLKENADFKLRALLRVYAESSQCSHIFFAGCHDVGYLSELMPYKDNSSRFTLLDAGSIRFHPEFAKLGMQVEKLPGVFRSTLLEHAVTGHNGPPGFKQSNSNVKGANNNNNGGADAEPGMPALKRTPSEPTSKSECTFNATGKCKYGSGCRFKHIINSPGLPSGSWRAAPLETDNKENNNNQNGNYAHKGGNANNHTHTHTHRNSISNSDNNDNNNSGNGNTGSKRIIPIDLSHLPRKGTVPGGFVAVNKNNYRLDTFQATALPEVNKKLQAYHSSFGNPCNMFHLVGKCHAGSGCKYSHEPVEPDVKELLFSLARALACKRYGKCRDTNCVHGHICQQPQCVRRGGKIFCRIPISAHNEDLKNVHFVAADSTPSNSATAPRYGSPSFRYESDEEYSVEMNMDDSKSSQDSST